MLAARVPPLRKIGKLLPALEINDSLQLLSALQWQYMQESMQACSMYAANVCSGDAVDVQRCIVYVPALQSCMLISDRLKLHFNGSIHT